jgi:hypothetical protein
METVELSERDRIQKEYKHLFVEPFEGIRVGDGWLWIIEKMLENFDWGRRHNTYRPNPLYVRPDDADDSYDPPMIIGDTVVMPFVDTNKPNDIKIFCIKEKFGGLRVHYTCDPYVSDTFARFESMAVELCHYTCEICGHLGRDVKTSGSGWIQMRCPVCEQKIIEGQAK